MPNEDFKLLKILVATDFSEHAAAALGRAVGLAEQTRAGTERRGQGPRGKPSVCRQQWQKS